MISRCQSHLKSAWSCIVRTLPSEAPLALSLRTLLSSSRFARPQGRSAWPNPWQCLVVCWSSEKWQLLVGWIANPSIYILYIYILYIYIYNSKNAKTKAGGCSVYNKLIFSQAETSRTNSDLKGCKQGTLYHANHAHSGDADVVPMPPLSFSKVWAARGFCYLRLAGHLQRLATSSMTQMFFVEVSGCTLRMSMDVPFCPMQYAAPGIGMLLAFAFLPSPLRAMYKT